jgi:hypothetical protein
MMMTKVSLWSIMQAACVHAVATVADVQIVTDGMVGPALTIGGPNHAITADLGRRAGRSSTTANAGAITVDVESILVADAGRIGSSSRGSGFAGSLLIRASDKLLLHDGEITAEALEGNGGNIAVDPIFIVLRCAA